MHILIIEDEQAAAQRLQKLITELLPEAQFDGICDSIETAIEHFREQPEPDLIFADIQLADGPSFEIFKEVEVSAPIIFTTAYDAYAIDAFKLNSIDYLLKPIKREELAGSLSKFERMQKRKTPLPIAYEQLTQMIQMNQHPQYQKRIVIRYGQHIKAVEIKDVAYFYIDSKVTFLRTFAGKDLPVDYNLDQLTVMLDPAHFFRINRKCILHIDAIAKMMAYSKSRVKIDLDPPFKSETIVSAERSASFKEWLKGAP